MPRNQFIKILESFRTRSNPNQQELADRMLGLARQEPRATFRDCFPAHLTASALITDPSKERVLLCHHRKLGKWLQLGGHADGDWDLAAAALREANEESGLTDLTWDNPEAPPEPVDLDIHVIPARPDEPEHYHFDVRYLFIARRPETIQVSSESLALKWADRQEAFRLATEPALHRLFKTVWRSALLGWVAVLWGCTNATPVDAGFGSAGVLSVDVTAGKDDDLTAVALQTDGKILLVGKTQTTTDDFAVVRVLTDGKIDETFGTKGIATVDFSGGADTARAIRLVAGEKMLLVGDTTDAAGIVHMAAARLNADGSLDPTFGTAGLTTITSGKRLQANGVAVSSDGRAYLAGTTTGPSGTLDVALAALKPNGTADTGFGTRGIASLAVGPEGDEAIGIELTAHGRLLVAGSSARSNRRDFLLAAFLTTGTIDTGFGSGGKKLTNVSVGTANQESTYSDDSTAAFLQGSAQMLLTVGTSKDDTNSSAVVVRHRPGGSLDPNFGTGGLASLTLEGLSLSGSSLMELPDGKLIVAVRVAEGDTQGVHLARLTADGVLDLTFTEIGFLPLGLTVPVDSPAILLQQSDGKFLVATTIQGTTRDFAISRFAP